MSTCAQVFSRLVDTNRLSQEWDQVFKMQRFAKHFQMPPSAVFIIEAYPL